MFISIEKLTEVAEKYGINTIYLFGSYYDGTFTKSSDLDLAYLTKVNKGSDEYKNIYLELRNLTEQEIDLVDLRKVGISFAFHIIKNSRILYEKDEEIRTDFEDRLIMKYLDFAVYRRIMIRELGVNPFRR